MLPYIGLVAARQLAANATKGVIKRGVTSIAGGLGLTAKSLAEAGATGLADIVNERNADIRTRETEKANQRDMKRNAEINRALALGQDVNAVIDKYRRQEERRRKSEEKAKNKVASRVKRREAAVKTLAASKAATEYVKNTGKRTKQNYGIEGGGIAGIRNVINTTLLGKGVNTSGKIIGGKITSSVKNAATKVGGAIKQKATNAVDAVRYSKMNLDYSNEGKGRLAKLVSNFNWAVTDPLKRTASFMTGNNKLGKSFAALGDIMTFSKPKWQHDPEKELEKRAKRKVKISGSEARRRGLNKEGVKKAEEAAMPNAKKQAYMEADMGTLIRGNKYRRMGGARISYHSDDLMGSGAVRAAGAIAKSRGVQKVDLLASSSGVAVISNAVGDVKGAVTGVSGSVKGLEQVLAHAKNAEANKNVDVNGVEDIAQQLQAVAQNTAGIQQGQDSGVVAELTKISNNTEPSLFSRVWDGIKAVLTTGVNFTKIGNELRLVGNKSLDFIAKKLGMPIPKLKPRRLKALLGMSGLAGLSYIATKMDDIVKWFTDTKEGITDSIKNFLGIGKADMVSGADNPGNGVNGTPPKSLGQKAAEFWENVKEGFKTSWDYIKDLFNRGWEWLKNISWDDIVKGLKAIKDGIVSLFGVIKSLIVGVWNIGNTIYSTIKEAFNSTDKLKEKFQSLWKSFGEFFQSVGERFKELMSSIKSAFQSLMDAVGEIIKAIMIILKPIFKMIVSILTVIWEVIEKIFKAVSTVVGMIFDVISGVVSLIGGLLKWVADTINWIRNSAIGRAFGWDDKGNTIDKSAEQAYKKELEKNNSIQEKQLASINQGNTQRDRIAQRQENLARKEYLRNKEADAARDKLMKEQLASQDETKKLQKQQTKEQKELREQFAKAFNDTDEAKKIDAETEANQKEFTSLADTRDFTASMTVAAANELGEYANMSEEQVREVMANKAKDEGENMALTFQKAADSGMFVKTKGGYENQNEKLTYGMYGDNLNRMEARGVDMLLRMGKTAEEAMQFVEEAATKDSVGQGAVYGNLEKDYEKYAGMKYSGSGKSGERLSIANKEMFRFQGLNNARLRTSGSIAEGLGWFLGGSKYGTFTDQNSYTADNQRAITDTREYQDSIIAALQERAAALGEQKKSKLRNAYVDRMSKPVTEAEITAAISGKPAVPEVNTQQSINTGVMKTLSVVAKTQADVSKTPVIINNNNVTNNNVAGSGSGSDKAAPKVVDNNVYFMRNIANTVAMNRVMNRSL
jgi:hypothetical protein|nr:MAG TPA: hypothetical protein [Caudoviricetes sp.]